MTPPAADASAAAETSFAGLRHLALPPDELACRETLLAGIDRLAETVVDPVDLRREVLALLTATHETGRQKVADALDARPHAGLRIARSLAHVTDVVVEGAVHFSQTCLHRAPIRTSGEKLAVIAVGGYGRGEMAPFSDVDLLFLTPWKQTPWGESVIESTLYLLWDLKLKVGQSARSIADCMRWAQADLTVRTAVLEMRFICGDRAPYDELEAKLWSDLFDKTGPDFVEAKIAERDERHKRNGGSRYMLEPNIKEGKGGLRDLQTLHWVSKYLYRCGTAWDLVEMGVFEHEEVQRFADAAKFIWAVRCHLHTVSGRAQENLTFDRQVEIAARMGYSNRDGRIAVEHFMSTYFRHAKSVGDLTRIFSGVLEAKHAKAPPVLSSLLRALSFRSGHGDSDEPFVVREGKLGLRDPAVITCNPVNLIRLFHEAARMDARIHPAALRLVTQNLDLIDDSLRGTLAAREMFLDILTDRQHGARILRLMNETEVLGRFIPEFGRIVAMMQFNMYHHYTVDEHTLRVIETLNAIERGEEDTRHPVAHQISKRGFDRRVLYSALLLHDIGKGDARDHSEYGAELAGKVCPRLGLDQEQTEMVVWLVRNHLIMSDVAQKRDIQDPGTIRDFAKQVQSPERLRLLLILTVCDIRGVGPGVWNNWKAQLLRTLYWDTRDVLTGGAEQASRAHRVDAGRKALAEALRDWPVEKVTTELNRHYPHYWLGLDPETQVIFAELARDLKSQTGMASRFLPDPQRDATKACLYMADHPGIFSRMAGAFAVAGASVVDARTYTTTDGMACSTFWIQDAEGHPFHASRLGRLETTIKKSLAGEVVPRDAIEERRREKPRDLSFTVPTRILFDNETSDLFTVIEVNTRDRLGVLHALTRTLTSLNLNIFSAIIATYGEHAVDVFYVKDLFGLKVRGESKQRLIERRLMEALDRLGQTGSARSTGPHP